MRTEHRLLNLYYRYQKELGNVLASDGMLLSDDNINDVLDPSSSTPIWSQIDQAFDTDLQKKFKSPSTAALRNQVHQVCKAHGNWDKKNSHCTPTATP
jgi:hypothetical protein